MKLRSNIQNNNETKLGRNNKIETRQLNPIINISQTKDEILFGQKSFLEIILGLIKKSQVEYLSNDNSNNINNNTKNKISLIKNILLDLIQNLKEIKVEKDKKIDLFQKQKDQREKDLKKLVFSTVLSKRSVSNTNYINTNYETLITENNETDYNKETPQLKLLNFKVENEIIKVENLAKRMSFIIQYYKTPHLIHEHRTEIICDDKKSTESMNILLHQKLISQREKFIETVNMKSLQDMRISSIQSQTIGYKNALKDISKSYKYVSTQEIITEENKSYMDTINEDEKDENVSNDDVNIDIKNNNVNSLKNLKLIDMNDVEKLLKLNMNINVNINYNKQYINNHFDSKKKVGNDDDNEANSSNFSKNENVGDDFDEIDKNECKNMEDENFDDSFKKNNKTG
jgi:hypothetical protein